MSYTTFNFNKLCFYAFFIFLLSACVPYENVVYLQEEAAKTYEIKPPTEDYKIQKSDLLMIDLKTLETSSKDFFDGNNQVGGAAAGGRGTGSPIFYLTGYLVEQDGTIDLPLVGKLNVEGKTTIQISNELEKELKKYMKFSEVAVRLANYRVTIMGEVNIPGVQYIYEKEYTLLQAIANAGNIGEFGNIKRIKLIRKSEKGKVKSTWLDLTDPKSLESEYMYLLPGDLVYVEPLKAKIQRSNFQNISLGISIVSLITTLITLFSR